MELATGEELDLYCTRFASGIPERIAKLIFQRVPKAVEILHDSRYCHLDLKLENIMYDRNTNKIKILDFGFARRTKTKRNEIKYHRTFCGSMHYLPPEIINNLPFDGTKADVWSLGIVLYGMLVDQFPFDGEEKELFRLITQNNPYFPPFLSTGATSLLKSMLKTNPEERPDISSLLTHPFFLD